MFDVVWDYYSSKLKGKQYKQNTSPKVTKLKSKLLLSLGYKLNRSLIGLWTTRPWVLTYISLAEMASEWLVKCKNH